MVKTEYFSHVVSLLISGVNDFEVIDNYMFATKSVSTLLHYFSILLFLLLLY